jgi:superfamily II DNA or RNA helicase/HKD family nuclease
MDYPTKDEQADWPHRDSLIHGDDDPLLPHLAACFPGASRVCIAVAFVLDQGVHALRPYLQDLLEREGGGELRLVTGDYFGVTEPHGLQRLLDLEGNTQLKVFETKGQAFHPKAYIFHYPDGHGIAFVGSSNLSKSALGNGVEWNYRIIRASDEAGFATVTRQFDRLFKHAKTVPLSEQWILDYAARRRPSETRAIIGVPDESINAPEPREIQRQCLEALRASRAAGDTSGLVVLATGLGKTWLSAFDVQAFAQEAGDDIESLHILFVAHRDEILGQALETFRKILPRATMGKYSGAEKTLDAAVLFASVQTLSRQAHLDRFAPDRFDYVIIDEFHHASATTYRKVLEHFQPRFLLGLTATPERTDGGDLLALCGQNLVFRCDLGDGVHRKELSPFEYYGVPDSEVDYAKVPWRSGRFVDTDGQLTQALATEKRAENALHEWQKRGGVRGLGFCCSVEHADYMAQFFRERGVAAVAVHSKPTSAPRANSLQDLEEGKLAMVFCVDMFNEGVDVPHVDTILMLRPTESRIVWLQQFGRGLRQVQGKVLKVVDYIGNHRVFLTKLQALLPTMLGMGDSHTELREAIMALHAGTLDLPDGCDITYELEAVEILKKLLRPSTGEGLLRETYQEFELVHGRRPTAREMHMAGALRKHVVKTSFGSWFEFVNKMGGLEYAQRDVLGHFSNLLTDIETSKMNLSYKMLVLEAMLEEGCLPGEITVPRLAQRFERIANRSPFLRRELEKTMSGSEPSIESMLKKNPLRAWTGSKHGKGSEFFELEQGVFRTRFTVRNQVAESRTEEVLAEMCRELVEWRLADYQERTDPERIACRITHTNDTPIIMLDRKKFPNLPSGQVKVVADETEYDANFVKIALNTLYLPEDAARKNQLPALLRSWFGAKAGHPGQHHSIAIDVNVSPITMSPLVANKPGELRVGMSCMREDIPPLFGETFTSGKWGQAGIVSIPQGLVLLVTLDKKGKAEDHRYKDVFEAPASFQWQSQNQTARGGKHGALIQGTKHPNREIHMFVRKRSKTGKDKAAPYRYCGMLDFARWEGEKPITVWWQLQTPLTDEMWTLFQAP